MASAYIFWYMHDEHFISFTLSFLGCMAFCVIYGTAVQMLIMHPLRRQSPLARMLATLGLLLTTEAIISRLFPQTAEYVQSSLPITPIRILGVSLGTDQVAIFGIVAAISLGLGALYRFSRFGLASTAIIDNATAAETLGYSINTITMANWVIGSMLAGLAGILLAPISGLSPTQMTLFVIPALAAASLGSLRSLPLAYLGGLMLGIAESEVGHYVTALGWSSAVPFIMILLISMIRERSLPGRADSSIRLPSVGTGRISAWTVVSAIVVATVLIETLNSIWVAGIDGTLVVGVILISIVVVTGYAGQLSLAQYTVAGLGGYLAAEISLHYQLPLELSLVVGTACGLPIGLLVGAPALRARGTNLAIMTLALALAVNAIIFQNTEYTGPTASVAIENTNFFGINVSNILYPRRYALLCLGIFVVVAIAVANLRRGRIGRRLLAVRANERAAASLGVGVWASKLYAFGLSSMIASLGGVLVAWQNSVLVPSQFDPITGISFLGGAVIGGVGFNTGSLFGATLQPGGLGTNIGQLFGAQVESYLELASGVILVLLLIAHPDGIANVLASQTRQVTAKMRSVVRRSSIQPKADELAPPTAVRRLQLQGPNVGTLSLSRPVGKKLTVSAVSVAFGGVKAVTDVSLEVDPGQIIGLIGPNGAGKSTLVDAITGYNHPQQGSVRLGDIEVARLSPQKRARLGLGRSFQHLELFDDLSVRENLLVACESRRWVSYITDLFWSSTPLMSSDAIAAINRLSLQTDLERRPSELEHGRRRLVAIARSMAMKPSVLLLDEPAAGLTEAECVGLSTLLRAMALEERMGVLLVDHDVDFVMRTCDRVIALDFGSVIATGTPAEVRSSRRVIESYLGEERTGQPTDGADVRTDELSEQTRAAP
jgi:sulfate-transporting ATPase